MKLSRCEKNIIVQALELWELEQQKDEKLPDVVKSMRHSVFVDLIRKVEFLEVIKK